MVFEIQNDISLAEFSTFKIGGKARYLIVAQDESDVIKGIEFAEKKKLATFILGGGSNVLISDTGFNGLVILIALRGIKISAEQDGKAFITAQAGEDWDEFVAFCVEKKFQGIECLSGIPGFVGGTPVQNVGAYGQEVSESIFSVKVFDRQTKQIKELTNKECGFAYRTSIFNTTEKNRFVVLAVTFVLTSGGKPQISYADLQKRFENKTPDLKETRDAVCEIRAIKAMLVRQTGADARSAGSFFKNPIVSNEKFAELKKIAEALKIENIPQYKVDERHVKIPAAWLIEKAGFYKGFTRNNAGLSTKHTLALTNRGGATAREILELKTEIQNKVNKLFGIELTVEPVFVGF